MRPLSQSSQGFTLIEILIALAVLGISVSAVAVKMRQAQGVLNETNRLMALDALEASITAFEEDPRVLNYSIEKATNSYLKSCVLQRNTCTQGKGFALDLYRVGDSAPMTGNSVRYDAQGKPCAPGPCQAAFSYRTIVFPSCARTATCSGPDYVLLRTDLLRLDRNPPKLVRSFVREVERSRDQKFPGIQLNCKDSSNVLRGIGLGGEALCVPLSTLSYADDQGQALPQNLQVPPVDCRTLDQNTGDQHYIQALDKNGKLSCANRFW